MANYTSLTGASADFMVGDIVLANADVSNLASHSITYKPYKVVKAEAGAASVLSTSGSSGYIWGYTLEGSTSASNGMRGVFTESALTPFASGVLKGKKSVSIWVDEPTG